MDVTPEKTDEAERLRAALRALVDAVESSTQPGRRGHAVNVALRNARSTLDSD